MKTPYSLPLLCLVAACGGEPATQDRVEPGVQPSISIRDSIRARRAARLATRPDTFGTKADSGRLLGADTARVWVVIASDFQCPRCREFAVRVLPVLREEFVDKGLVRLAFVNSPQDRYFNARFAAIAALCAGRRGRFWEFHDSLFANQPVWERMPDPRPYMDTLAASAGVPFDAQARCTSGQAALPLLTGDIERSRKSGVLQVPSVFVGDRLLTDDELTVSGLRRAIRGALADAKAKAGDG